MTRDDSLAEEIWSRRLPGTHTLLFAEIDGRFPNHHPDPTVPKNLEDLMRAVAADREAAEMLGVNVNFTIAVTFFLGSALAGVAGVMAGLLFNQVTNTIGFIAGLKAFTAAVVGGIGSIPGAMLGGLMIGLAESFVTGYLSSTYSNLLVFLLLIAVMLVRPSGLLGQAQLQKV